MCIYQKNGAFQIGIQKNRAIHIPFVEKMGPIIYLAALKKGAIRHAHPYYAIYRKLRPPPTPVIRYTINHLTLKTPRKPASENVCLCRLLNILANFSNLFFAYRQTVWTQIRLLLKEQSDLDPHCLQKWLLNSQADDPTRWQLLWLAV